METGFGSNIAAITPPGVTLRIVERVADAFTVMAMVGAGIGISVVSESLTRVAMQGVVFRRITGVTRTADIALVHRMNEGAQVVAAFIDSVRSHKRLR